MCGDFISIYIKLQESFRMQYPGQVQFLLATDLWVLYIYTIHIYINGIDQGWATLVIKRATKM